MTDTAQWSFPSNAQPVPNYDLKVFTLTPNWKNGVLERVEFLTDIMSSEIAAEQRRSSRRSPRRSFEVSFLRADGQRSELDAFFTGMGRSTFMVPLWHEQFRLMGQPNDEGAVHFPAGTLQYREFKTDDLVWIQEGSRWDVLTVMDVDISSDTMWLATPADIGPWSPNSRIMPLRRARLMDQSSITSPANRVGLATVRFNLMDADNRWNGDGAYTWSFKPDRATEITNNYDRTDFVIDFKGGVIEVEDPGQRAQIGTSLALTLFGREKINAYRRFVYGARGRARRFYMPTYTQDLQPISPPSSNYVDCLVTNIDLYQDIPQAARTFLVVSFKDQEAPPIYRRIVTLESISEGGYKTANRFYIDGSFPDDMTLEEIDTICFLSPTRFDQDTFEIFYPTDDLKAAKVAVVVMSTDGDDMSYDLDLGGGGGGGGGSLFPITSVEQFFSDIYVPSGSTLV